MMIWVQVYLFAMSMLAAYLLTSGKTKWGSLVGLWAQPAWFYSSWETGSWGIFAISFWFTFCYARGYYRGLQE